MTAALAVLVLAAALTACGPDEDTEPDAPARYESCAEARDAGDAPLKRGRDAGYRSALDRDGDGWACDDV